eukprot:scaffold3632_cov162-Amphora_coffeaeformis.AAC.15
MPSASVKQKLTKATALATGGRCGSLRFQQGNMTILARRLRQMIGHAGSLYPSPDYDNVLKGCCWL